MADHGWDPLNYNLLLHSEINLANKDTSRLTSAIQPEELNLTAVLSGMFTNKIVLFRNQEAAQTGENATDLLHQRKMTAQEAIAQGKRLTVGLHVALGNFTSGAE